MTDSAAPPTVLEVVNALDRRYPRDWAESWDRVGLVLGDFGHAVRRVLCVVDCVPETVDQALAEGADLIVAHQPLLLKPVSSIAPGTFKGRIIHRLIRGDVALNTAHTNDDVADPGVSDALAARLGLTALRPLVPATGAAAQPVPPSTGAGPGSSPTRGGPGPGAAAARGAGTGGGTAVSLRRAWRGAETPGSAKSALV